MARSAWACARGGCAVLLGTGPGAASGSGARARFSGRLPQKGPPSLVPGETHWGRKTPIGVGNLPTPMHSCLPRWPVGCSNASFPMPCCLPQWPIACSNASFLMLYCLPQWPVAYPNARFLLLCCLPQWPVACSNAPFLLLCCLPQCTLAYPNGLLPAPMRLGPWPPGIAGGRRSAPGMRAWRA